MKKSTVAFVLHRNINKQYREITKKLSSLLSKLIEEENAETFLFSFKGSFNYLCFEVLTDLKRYYPLINRVLVLTRYEYIREINETFLLHTFDELFVPEKGNAYYSYKNRYYIMVDKCDILVTYYDKNYKLLKGKATATKNAVERALEQNKRIINLAEEYK